MCGIPSVESYKSSQITNLFDSKGKRLEDKDDIACELADEFIGRDSECDISLCSDMIKVYENDYQQKILTISYQKYLIKKLMVLFCM